MKLFILLILFIVSTASGAEVNSTVKEEKESNPLQVLPTTIQEIKKEVAKIKDSKKKENNPDADAEVCQEKDNITINYNIISND